MPDEKKQWRMYKKADTSIEFNSNIIPKFSKLTTTDDHGTWTVSYSASSNQAPSVWRAFDYSTSTTCDSHRTTSTLYTHYIQLDLPDGLAISPETIVSVVRDSYSGTTSTLKYKVHVRGLNADTGAWDILTESHSPKYNSSTPTTYTDTVLISNQYYTQFRFYIQKIAGTTSSENGLKISEYQITKGRYKKLA